LLSESQRDRISVVLVSPRNPLNIGAVARAMANFGFRHLSVVSAYEPHWREARSAIGSSEILQHAEEFATVADAVRECTFILGTGSLTHRKPDQPAVKLNEIAPLVNDHLVRDGKIAVIFGPEKQGLTRENLSFCHVLVEIPTHPQQPSMNLGQAAAVCLYELAARTGHPYPNPSPKSTADEQAPSSGQLDILALLIHEVMVAARYSPKNMQEPNRHDLRLMLRRMHLNTADQRRVLGLFRRILWRFKQPDP